MLLTEIASFVNISSNNQLSPEQVTLLLDGIQKSVFQKNQAAFLQYTNILKIFKTYTLISSGYVDAVTSDIGKDVIGEDTGTIGTLIAYDNDLREWTIDVTATPGADEIIQVGSGTGSGQLNGGAAKGYRGPYAAPTDVPCRKIWGITQRKPGRFWLEFAGCAGVYWVNGLINTGDYLAFWGPIAPFETGQTDDLQNTFMFSFDPSLKAVYYWVYWRNPPSITELDNSTQLIIPEAYHHQVLLACNDLAGAILNREPLDYDQMIEGYLGGWIDAIRAPFRDQRLNQNMTQNGGTGFGLGFGYGGIVGSQNWIG